jgi:hypothetical protein
MRRNKKRINTTVAFPVNTSALKGIFNLYGLNLQLFFEKIIFI